jgi:hypothetical protein
MLIYYWPSGEWCYEEELHEMSHLSDDYSRLIVAYCVSEELIDQFVRLALSPSSRCVEQPEHLFP